LNRFKLDGVTVTPKRRQSRF